MDPRTAGSSQQAVPGMHTVMERTARIPPALLAPLRPHSALKARHRASAAPTDPSSETRNHEAPPCLAQRRFSFPAIVVGAPATGECPGSSRSGYPRPVDLVGRASCKVMGTFRSLTNTQHVAPYQFYFTIFCIPDSPRDNPLLLPVSMNSCRSRPFETLNFLPTQTIDQKEGNHENDSSNIDRAGHVRRHGGRRSFS